MVGQVSGCDVVRPLLAELALGTLPGAERASALVHLESCAGCRHELDELSEAADALLLAVRAADPPVGFEVRLLDRMRLGDGTSPEALPAVTPTGVVPTGVAPTGVAPTGVAGPDSRGTAIAGSARTTRGGTAAGGRRRLLSRRVLTLAAAVVVLAAGVAVGAAWTGRPASPRPATTVASGQIRTAKLFAPGHGAGTQLTGEVIVAAGQPAWVLMDVTGLAGASWVSCVVETAGRSISVGSFQLRSGDGSWAAPLDAPGASVRSARIVGPDGTVLATATF